MTDAAAGDPSVRELEDAFLAAWPALATIRDGAWIWRWARGYTKRANSMQCLDPADDGASRERLLRLCDQSCRHDIPPVFRVTPLAGPGVLAELDRGGWIPFEESLVLVRPLDGAEAEEAAGAGGADVVELSPTDPDWSGAYARLSGYDGSRLAGLRELLGAFAVQAAGLMLVDEDGAPIAVALAAKSGRIGATFNVVADPGRRRQGLGRRIMAAALAWQARAGAGFAGIQVIGANAAARALYDGLGYREAYRYHYRRPSGA